MKKTLILIMMLLASSLTMAQLSPGAEGIRQKVAEYARQQGMKANYDGDALSIQRDTMSYELVFTGVSPVYVEIRVTDLDISSCVPACIAKAANYINLHFSSVKASIVPTTKKIRFSAPLLVNDAQSVIVTLNQHLDNLAMAWRHCSQKYDEFVYNQDFTNLRIPFEVYSANVVNVDKDDQLLTEYGFDIKSADTQYINTLLTMIVYEEGDYQIDVQFIMPDGSVSKAADDGSDYTFSTILHMTSDQPSYITGGWGSTNPGTWGPGNYQIVFYYKSKPFYAKQFKIY
ncbi:MAG: hypothetical protein II075_12420 [Bacteroidales bacterium]|nr:hypothetical protein [Bacteroidales bacterium]